MEIVVRSASSDQNIVDPESHPDATESLREGRIMGPQKREKGPMAIGPRRSNVTKAFEAWRPEFPEVRIAIEPGTLIWIESGATGRLARLGSALLRRQQRFNCGVQLECELK